MNPSCSTIVRRPPLSLLLFHCHSLDELVDVWSTVIFSCELNAILCYHLFWDPGFLACGK